MLPPLTTVQMSCKRLAETAVQALRAGIEPGHPQAQQREWHISTQLVVRQSTAFPRGSLPALAKTKPAARRGAAK
jgi:LacI family transcriptional regulator